MRTLFLTALLATAFAAPSFADEQQVNLSVPGMNCPSCPFIVQAAIESVDGVRSVVADATERVAVVVFDDNIATIDAITSASLNAGYEATVIESGT